ncbi:hypothetical protein [Paenibacillus xylanexedens]|uniref:hypothetical protein n=1 Tax=Paenibacillus xylanexedens TaxID=528191 RepID=UPI003B013CCC
MVRAIFIFILGQLLLLSIIFNQTIYPIFELNHLGDDSLSSYSVENYNGDNLRKLYKSLNEQCKIENKCKFQLIKTPVSNDNKMIYEIYHSDLANLNLLNSTSSNKTFNYYLLTEEEFIDSDGAFSTNLDEDILNNISSDIGIALKADSAMIEYQQIFQSNSINFGILLILSQLIFFIYTFTRVKVNAVKKVLGFSSLRMVMTSLRKLILLQSILIPIIFGVHIVYYLSLNNIVTRYFFMLFFYLLIIGIVNLMMLLITQVSLKYIDISLMIKNKVYSNRLNLSLYAVKIILILSITVSASIFSQNFVKYKEALHTYDKFSNLENYYTSIGYNSDEYEKALQNKNLLVEYGDSVKEILQHFRNSDQLYVHNFSSVLSQLSSSLLERRGTTREEVLSDFRENHIFVNETYLNTFVDILDPQGMPIHLQSIKGPTILVPEKHKRHEQEIIEYYTKRYNALLSYNENYEIESTNSNLIKSVDILYIANGLKPELLGKGDRGELSGEEIEDPIIILDQGDFDDLYYYDQLNQGNIIIKADSREEFSTQVKRFNLSNLVIEGSLITPFQSQISSTEFYMQQSFIFVVLFLITLVFVIYISNYIDVMFNRKNLANKYGLGFSNFRILRSRLLITLILLSATFLNFFIPFNLIVYLSILLVDIIILFILYRVVIVRNIHKILRGGS